MRLFINSGVFKRDIAKSAILKDGRLKLSIPNYSEKTGKSRNVNFIIPNCAQEMLEGDVLISNLSLVKENKNKYVFSETYDSCESESIYALIRSTTAVPDDVYIPETKIPNVEMICRVRPADFECDYGGFLGNVYLIKITLKPKESVQVYLTTKKGTGLRERFVFYRPMPGVSSNWVIRYEDEEIEESVRYIQGYISLSELM